MSSDLEAVASGENESDEDGQKEAGFQTNADQTIDKEIHNPLCAGSEFRHLPSICDVRGVLGKKVTTARCNRLERTVARAKRRELPTVSCFFLTCFSAFPDSIGNAAYEHATPLQKPKKDADAIADMLARLEFETLKKTSRSSRIRANGSSVCTLSFISCQLGTSHNRHAASEKNLVNETTAPGAYQTWRGAESYGRCWTRSSLGIENLPMAPKTV